MAQTQLLFNEALDPACFPTRLSFDESGWGVGLDRRRPAFLGACTQPGWAGGCFLPGPTRMILSPDSLAHPTPLARADLYP